MISVYNYSTQHSTLRAFYQMQDLQLLGYNRQF